MARIQLYKDPHRTSVVAEKKDWDIIKRYCNKRGRKERPGHTNGVILTPSLLVSDLVTEAAKWIKSNPGRDMNVKSLVDQVLKELQS